MPIPGGPRPTQVPAHRLTQVAAWAGAVVAPGADDVAVDDVVVTGVTLSSRTVRAGDLYAALPGSRAHGADFTAQAARAGAVAVLTDVAGAERAAGAGLPVLVVPDPRGVLGCLAAQVYGRPAERLLMLAVTGTNGKTTTTFLLDAAVRAAGHRTGLIGTVEIRVGDERVESTGTTPEAPDLHALFAVMLEHGVDACAMEISSHALSQHRVDGLVVDVAGFTNLSQDHLDYHHSMEEYFATKAELFTPQRARRAVICVDDAWGRRLAVQAAQAGLPVQTVSSVPPGPSPAGELRVPGGPGAPGAAGKAGEPGEAGEVEAGQVEAGQAPQADWRVTRLDVVDGHPQAEVAGPNGLTVTLRSPLPGQFNLANSLLALAMLVATGTPADEAARAIAAGSGVPGRMERVSGVGAPGEPLAVVDYAHSPDAVHGALTALDDDGRRLVVVLGAGGDRDREKRPLMGAAAVECADVVIVTDDNPRSEDPAEIRAAVLLGTGTGRRAGTVLEIADRRAAIAEGVRRAWDGGVLLVAGKGHEPGQEIAGRVYPFDDRVELREALLAEAARRHGTAVGVPAGAWTDVEGSGS